MAKPEFLGNAQAKQLPYDGYAPSMTSASRSSRMMANAGQESLDEAFERVRDLDASLGEQLRAFAEAVRQRTPDFAAAADRLVERLRKCGAAESAPQVGEPMPTFVLPDDTSRLVSLAELLRRGPVPVTFPRAYW